MYLKNKKNISVSLSNRDIEALDVLCKRVKKNRSEMIRFFIKAYLAQMKGLIYENQS